MGVHKGRGREGGANGTLAVVCSACRSLVEIDFLMLKQLFPSLTEQNKHFMTKK